MIKGSSEKDIVDLVTERVCVRFAADGSGHGIDHVMRVLRLAERIAGEEKCDKLVVSLAALLHDAGDYKLSADGNENHCDAVAELLQGIKLPDDIVAKVVYIVERVSFKGNGITDEPMPPEGQCVRDADRLDAMGAIGVARAFAFGALNGRIMFDPSCLPCIHNSFDMYKSNRSHTINHFYEKLLLLKDRMETASGKRLSEGRHSFLEAFLVEFTGEWDAKM
jgi:uncharacterized protein